MNSASIGFFSRRIQFVKAAGLVNVANARSHVQMLAHSHELPRKSGPVPSRRFESSSGMNREAANATGSEALRTVASDVPSPPDAGTGDMSDGPVFRATQTVRFDRSYADAEPTEYSRTPSWKPRMETPERLCSSTHGETRHGEARFWWALASLRCDLKPGPAMRLRSGRCASRLTRRLPATLGSVIHTTSAARPGERGGDGRFGPTVAGVLEWIDFPESDVWKRNGKFPYNCSPGWMRRRPRSGWIVRARASRLTCC